MDWTPLFQIAFDDIEIGRIESLAEVALRGGVDRLEVGSSLIKRYGTEPLRRLRSAFPNSFLYADTKSLDQPLLEVRPMIDAGASAVTALVGMDDGEMRQSVDFCKHAGVEFAVSTMGYPADEIADRCTHLRNDVDVSTFVAHGSGLPGVAFMNLLACLRSMATVTGVSLMAGGGIDLSNVCELHTFRLDVVIVGRSMFSPTDFPSTIASMRRALRVVS